MTWLIEKVLFSLSKTKLLKLVWKIFRKVFKRLYWAAAAEVEAAERNMPEATGFEKADAVAKNLITNFDELSEWEWLCNILIEVAVGEYKQKEESV